MTQGPPDGSSYERELESRLWNEGFASFRVAGSGTIGHSSADVVAFKNGHLFVFEVKSFKGDSLPLMLKENKSQMLDIIPRCLPVDEVSAGDLDDHNVHAGYALRSKESDTWSYSPWYEHVIDSVAELRLLYEVLMEAEYE